MSVPYTFATATSTIPLSQLDSNFSYFADAISVSSGNVGIGANTPNSKLDVRFAALTSSTQLNHILLQSLASGSTSQAGARTGITFNNRNQQYSDSGGISTSGIYGVDEDTGIYGRNMGLAFYTSTLDAVATERMRIDSSGNVFINATDNPYSSQLYVQSVGGGVAGVFRSAYGGGVLKVIGAGETYGGGELLTIGVESTANFNAIIFRNDTNGVNTQVGYVACTSTSTSYNSGSDYRLKENVHPIVGALDRVSNLKPVTYNWKINSSAGEGFIAHELAEVCPLAVTGEKDAVKEDGTIDIQGVDPSKIVALLTAAIQELKAELDFVKSQLSTLQGN